MVCNSFLNYSITVRKRKLAVTKKESKYGLENIQMESQNAKNP